MWGFIRNFDFSPLFISAKTGLFATVISFFLSVFLARAVISRGRGFKAILDGFLTMPLVLPPTVAGFFLLLLFSPRRPVGAFLLNRFDLKIVQSWLGCVIAATVVSFPFMYKSVRSSFEKVDYSMLEASRMDGLNEWQVLWKMYIPDSMNGILSGAILCFARAMGEYGATSMLAGNIPGKTATISQQIAMVIQDGDYLKAGIWSVMVMILAFAIIVLLNFFLGDKNK